MFRSLFSNSPVTNKEKAVYLSVIHGKQTMYNYALCRDL